jgi:hypothetical protein
MVSFTSPRIHFLKLFKQAVPQLREMILKTIICFHAHGIFAQIVVIDRISMFIKVPG